MGNSTPKKRSRKHFVPPKPYKDFPLTPHARGAWMKRINGRLLYFGHWAKTVKGQLERLPNDGWQAALDLYKAQADDLHAGRTPRVQRLGEGKTLADLCNRFLNFKLNRRKVGEITVRMFTEYKATTDLLIGQFGEQRQVDDLVSDDFELLRNVMADRWGPVRLCNEIQKVKTVFKYAYESGLIDRPVRYGQFKKPSAGVLRRHRAKNGERMIEAAELRQLIDAAPTPLRAMLLLGINCGFNNKDCADLPQKAIDLKGGWCNFPRPKTGIKRRCPLWPETVTALQEAIAARPEPRSDAAEPLVFVTTRGRPWIVRDTANPVSVAMRGLMKAVGIHRDGIGFATLRHVFRTVADGSRDQVAVGHIMGHSDPSMGGVYRERIDDERLVAVVEHVRAWLFGNQQQGGDIVTGTLRHPTTPVTVEYDKGGQRVRKEFGDAHEAKRFYRAKDKAGHNPKLVAEDVATIYLPSGE